MSLEGATGWTGGLLNGRPISQWKASVVRDRYKRAPDGSPLFRIAVEALATEHSGGLGGKQPFLSYKRYTALELQAGVSTKLTDSVIAETQAAASE
jgi:hypothetical protein